MNSEIMKVIEVVELLRPGSANQKATTYTEQHRHIKNGDIHASNEM
jgi:hypothetical protein